MNAVVADIDGYVGDVAYPSHFHRETMPLWLHAVTTALGHAAPDVRAPYTYCELGCGDGFNLVLAAAANPRGAFVGIDANAGHIDQARRLSQEAGLSNVRFIHADIRHLDADAGLPAQIDFIVAHGFWSWVDDSVQQAFCAFVEQRLAPGGLLYLAYMSHPGASAMQGVARLMREVADQVEGDSAAKAQAGLAFARRLAAAGAGFAEHAGVLRQLDAMTRESPAYLAHEFLTDHWRPQHAAEVIRRFEALGCRFIGSAVPADNIDAVSVPGDTQPLLRDVQTQALAETVRDLARNQSQRRDLYQRGAMKLSTQAHLAALDDLRFAALPGAPTSGSLSFNTRIGVVPGPAEMFDPALRALASGPQRFADLRRLPAYAQQPGLLNQVMQMLLWSGCAHPLREDGLPDSAALTRLSTLMPVAQSAWQPSARFGSALASTGR